MKEFIVRTGQMPNGAVRQVRDHAQAGYRQVVDLDLEKFFDRVDHDVLMHRVALRVRDKRVLKLIGRYLRCGVVVEGKIQATREGTPQGGPLSPLLANMNGLRYGLNNAWLEAQGLVSFRQRWVALASIR